MSKVGHDREGEEYAVQRVLRVESTNADKVVFEIRRRPRGTLLGGQLLDTSQGYLSLQAERSISQGATPPSPHNGSLPSKGFG